MRHVFSGRPPLSLRHVGAAVLACVLACSAVALAQDAAEPVEAEKAPARRIDVGAGVPSDIVVTVPPAGTDEESVSVAITALRGDPAKPVALFYWSPTCPVSKRYVAKWDALVDELGSKVAFVVIRVAARDEAEDTDGVERPPRGTACDDPENAAGRRLGVRVTPTSLVVDREGVLRFRGPLDDDRRARGRDERDLLGPALEALLAGETIEAGDARSFGSAIR